MAIMTVAIWPVLIIIAVILALVVYSRTKSWPKVGYLFEIIIALVVWVMSVFLTNQAASDALMIVTIGLLGLGLLINGLIGLLKK